jgi:protocatechuate 3,4-dioxygenase beta subunit
MRRHAIACALLLALLTTLPSEGRAQFPMPPAGEMPMMLPPGRKAKTGTGRLRGRVVAADTGSIVRRAQVRISSPDIGSKTAFTDGQGRYEFRDLPAGRFNVSVSKSGFVTMQYGQTRPFEAGRPIDLVDAQVMEKADVALPRGSVVSGRVLDEFGEPVANATVSAMRKEYSMGKRRLAPSGRGSMTNDLGQFRLFGLPPGEYYVSATVRSFESMMMDMMSGGAGGPIGSNNDSGYAASYYPGTPNPGEAQRISLAVGQELANADIQMQPVRLARITGSAFSSDGKPMSASMVMLMPTMKDAMQFMPGGTSQTDKDGNFTLNGVAPGEYTVQVQSLAAIMKMATDATAALGGDAAAGSPPAQAMEREFAIGAVTIAGEDVTGLIINGARGAKARGRVVFEGGPKPGNLTSIRLLASPTDFDMVSVTASAFGAAAVKGDGAFEIDGLVGGRVFRFMDPPAGWFLKRVTHDNDDITDKGYAFKPGEEVEGFEIVMTTRSQPVSGTVTNEKGEPAKNYTVVVFPEDPQQWMATTSRSHASSRPDQQGRFRFAELPPGAYLAIAVEYVAQGEWMDPEWLERAAKKATAFTLTEGAAKTLNLKLAGS